MTVAGHSFKWRLKLANNHIWLKQHLYYSPSYSRLRNIESYIFCSVQIRRYKSLECSAIPETTTS